MINVNQLTAQLRMLPDAVLQRVAMMYKNDPYILSMAVSEDRARKQLRAAGQAQAARGPQPKVNDQAVASIGYTPEEMGIAGLAAPNMQGMADGGIAGYDDANFTQRSEPVVRMAEGGVARYQAGGQPKQPPYPGLAQYGDLATGQARTGTLLPTTTGYEGMSIDEFVRAAYNDVSDYLKGLYGKIPKESWAQEAAKDLAEKKRREEGERLMRPAAGTPRRTPRTLAIEEADLASRASRQPPQEALREPPLINPETGFEYTAGAPAESSTRVRPSGSGAAPSASRAPSAGTADVAPSGGVAGAGAPAAGGRMPSIYDLANPASARAAAQLISPTAKYETAFNVQAQKEREREEAREAERERDRPKGKVKEGLEALLKQEGEGAAKEKSDAGAFALIRAGLAIASGSSSNTLKNVADGLGVGAQEYQAALKDLKKADRERKFMLADIEEARRLEARGDYDRAQDRKDKALDREIARERFTMQGIMQLGISQDQLTGSLFGQGLKAIAQRDLANIEQAGAMARTQFSGDIQVKVAEINAKARQDPNSKEALAAARVQTAINSSHYLKQLAEKAALGVKGAEEKYRAEEERLYLQLAPELLLGVGAGAAGNPNANAAAKAAGDAILGRQSNQ